MFRKIPDNFFLGVALGALVLFVGKNLIHYIRVHQFTENSLPPFLHEPKPELVVLLANIFLFRFLMIKLSYERTGKGVLFCTVALVVIYYFGKFK